MGLNFKNTTTKEPVGAFQSQYIGYGVNLVKINDAEIKVASTGKIQIKFLVEGPEIPGFEGADIGNGVKAKGLVGRVNLGSYFDKEDSSKQDWLLSNLMAIAEKAGVSDKLATIEASSVEDLIAKFIKVIQNKYLWFIIKGDQYEKDGKTGFALSFKEGKVGEENGKKLFQIYVKEEKFKESVEEVDGRIIKVKGTNSVGSSKGKKDSLEFNPKYDLKLVEKADKEAGDTDDEVAQAKNDDLPF